MEELRGRDPFALSLRERLRGSGIDGQVVSVVLHALFFAMFALARTPFGADDDDFEISRDRIAVMRVLLDSAAEREADRILPEPTMDPGAAGHGPASAQKGKGGSGTEGEKGRPEASTRGHFSNAGNAAPEHMPGARERALAEAKEFGMVGLLAAGNANSSVAASPWGLFGGSDAETHFGNAWSPNIDDSIGALGLSGTGECGCGEGQGIGLGNIGTLGHGNGGVALPKVAPLREHVVRRASVSLLCGYSEGSKEAETGCMASVGGRLPPEVIQRVVRQNFGRMRLCYESGLRTNPSLAGRVSVKFVIDRGGAVAVAADGGSDLPDDAVRECVIRAFSNLSFPEPEGGIVTVVYPLVFSSEASF